MGAYYSILGSDNKEQQNKGGWIPDFPDMRDKKIEFNKRHYRKVRSRVDLRSNFGHMYNQKGINSSTICAVCSAFVYDQKTKNFPKFNPSRLFLYYNVRKQNDCINEDNGTSIRDTLRCLNKIGICDEKYWPYDTNFILTKPEKKAYDNIKFKGSIRYKKVNKSLDDLKACLSIKKPIIFGYAIYSSFEDPTLWDPKSDSMPIPKINKEVLMGGQTGVLVGYADKRKAFIVRNNFGKKWGMNGYFLMPYKYCLSEACSDFWTIETVNDDEEFAEENEHKSNEHKSNEHKSNENKSNENKESGSNNYSNDYSNDYNESDESDDEIYDPKYEKRNRYERRNRYKRKLKLRNGKKNFEKKNFVKKSVNNEEQIINIEIPEIKDKIVKKCLIRED